LLHPFLIQIQHSKFLLPHIHLLFSYLKFLLVIQRQPRHRHYLSFQATAQFHVFATQVHFVRRIVRRLVAERKVETRLIPRRKQNASPKKLKRERSQF